MDRWEESAVAVLSSCGLYTKKRPLSIRKQEGGAHFSKDKSYLKGIAPSSGIVVQPKDEGGPGAREQGSAGTPLH